MAVTAYELTLDGDYTWEQRDQIIRDAQSLASFLHIGVNGNRRTIRILFTAEEDVMWFKLKWMK
jgi:hypothetical protein